MPEKYFVPKSLDWNQKTLKVILPPVQNHVVQVDAMTYREGYNIFAHSQPAFADLRGTFFLRKNVKPLKYNIPPKTYTETTLPEVGLSKKYFVPINIGIEIKRLLRRLCLRFNN